MSASERPAAMPLAVPPVPLIPSYSSRLHRRQRNSDYYLQREPLPGCPSFYDMGQPQVFKSEIVDNYRGTKNLTATSVAETDGTAPWLVFTVKSTRPAPNAVRAVFVKLGAQDEPVPQQGGPAAARPNSALSTPAAAGSRPATVSGNSASPAASRRARRAPAAEDPCTLAAVKVESDNCVSMHTMAVPFAAVEKCGGFTIDNGTRLPGYVLYQTRGYLTWSDIILTSPGNTTTTTYLSTFPLTFRRGIPGLFTPDTPVDYGTDLSASAAAPAPAASVPVGLIAGIAAGAAVLLAALLATFFLVRRRREAKRQQAVHTAYLTFLDAAAGPSDKDGKDGDADKASTSDSASTLAGPAEPTKPSKALDDAAFKDIEIVALDDKSRTLQRVGSTKSVRNARLAGIVVEQAPGQFAVITAKAGGKLPKVDTDLSFSSDAEAATPKTATPMTAVVDDLPPTILPTSHEIAAHLGAADLAVPEPAAARESVYWGAELASFVRGEARQAEKAEEEEEVDEPEAFVWEGDDGFRA